MGFEEDLANVFEQMRSALEVGRTATCSTVAKVKPQVDELISGIELPDGLGFDYSLPDRVPAILGGTVERTPYWYDGLYPATLTISVGEQALLFSPHYIFDSPHFRWRECLDSTGPLRADAAIKFKHPLTPDWKSAGEQVARGVVKYENTYGTTTAANFSRGGVFWPDEKIRQYDGSAVVNVHLATEGRMSHVTVGFPISSITFQMKLVGRGDIDLFLQHVGISYSTS